MELVMVSIKERVFRLQPSERLAITDLDSGDICGLYRDREGAWLIYTADATTSAGNTPEEAWSCLEMVIEDDLVPNYKELEHVVESYPGGSWLRSHE